MPGGYPSGTESSAQAGSLSQTPAPRRTCRKSSRCKRAAPGRIAHGLVASPGRTREGGGQPRLEQHRIAAACVDQQANLYLGWMVICTVRNGHASSSGATDSSSAVRREPQHALPIIDAETGAREDVEPDDGVDAHTFEVGEVADTRGHRARLSCADAESIQNRALNRHALAKRDEHCWFSLHVQLAGDSAVDHAWNGAVVDRRA